MIERRGLEAGEHWVQVADQLIQDAGQTFSIQQVRYGAKHIAQQIAGARNRRDIAPDLVQRE